MDYVTKIKYISIKMSGHNVINAYYNPDANSENKQPLFKGDGVAVWLNEKEKKIDPPKPDNNNHDWMNM